MKYIIVLLSFLSLCSAGCKNDPDNQSKSPVETKSFNDSLLNSVLRLFAVPYSENLTLDSNSIIFYGSRPLDTSFLIHLKREPKAITGMYYEVDPFYHNDFTNFAVPESKLLFYEGYSFTLESSRWQEIKDQADKLLSENAPFDINIACMDCAQYGLHHGNRSVIGRAIIYKPFYQFLKGRFLDSFIAKRKLMFQINNETERAKRIKERLESKS